MFTKGEVVWAKIKGFPWWPGVVAKVLEDKENDDAINEVLVNFIGENSHARLPIDKVAKFEDNLIEFGKMKKKKLLESIEIARSIISGETSYEEEREKLERREKGLPTPVGKRKKESPPPIKEEESEEESEIQPSPVSHKNKPKIKLSEKKTLKMKQISNPVHKSPMASSADRSPVIIKNTRSVSNISQPSHSSANGVQAKEPEHKEVGKPRIRKLLKLDSESEEHRQSLKEIAPAPQISIPLAKSVSEANEPERRSERNVSRTIKINNSFNDIHEIVMERVANADTSNIINLEKKINNILNKMNPETAPMADLLDREVGKNIHTLLILLDELINAVPDMDAETAEKISNIKDQLINTNNIIKGRLALYFVENIEFCNGWLRKLGEKIEHKGAEKENEKKEVEKMERETELVTPKEKHVRENSFNKRNHHQDKDSESEHSAFKDHVDKIDEELANGISSTIEEEKHNGHHNHHHNSHHNHHDEHRNKNFDEHRTPKQAEKNQMVTTSTKLPKPKPKTELPKKPESKHKDSVMNPNLRKKICLKMAKLIQDRHNVTREKAQELTLKVENKIRILDPEMGHEYKDKIVIVLKLIKFSLFNLDEFLNNTVNDFSELQNLVHTYEKTHHTDTHLDCGLVEDSPSLNRDAKSENLSCSEVNNGESMSIDTGN